MYKTCNWIASGVCRETFKRSQLQIINATNPKSRMEKNNLLLYGANGYTGQLIARYANTYGLQPLLAGRNELALQKMAAELNLPYVKVSLDDARVLESVLKQVKVVVHAAGPFHQTAWQMIDACLKTKTHYIDINGDVSVFEMIRTYDQRARDNGIMLLPGAGFDVVPTDCTALMLKEALPDASSLQLAFVAVGGGLSHGTATTMVNKLGEGGLVRKNGSIEKVPLGHKGFHIFIGGKKYFVMSIPWGDVSTAYVTTGISNIETYTGIPSTVYRLLQFQKLFNWLLRTSFIRKLAQNKIEARPAGPNDEMRSKAKALVWGKAFNDEGKEATVMLETPDGYTLTAHSSLIIANKILQENFKPGYQTPASAYGSPLVFEIPGAKKL